VAKPSQPASGNLVRDDEGGDHGPTIDEREEHHGGEEECEAGDVVTPPVPSVLQPPPPSPLPLRACPHSGDPHLWLVARR